MEYSILGLNTTKFTNNYKYYIAKCFRIKIDCDTRIIPVEYFSVTIYLFIFSLPPLSLIRKVFWILILYLSQLENYLITIKLVIRLKQFLKETIGCDSFWIVLLLSLSHFVIFQEVSWNKKVLKQNSYPLGLNEIV